MFENIKIIAKSSVKSDNDPMESPMKILSHFAMAIALISAGGLVSMPQSALAQKEKKDKKKNKKGKESQQDTEPQLQASEGFVASYISIESLLTAGDAEGAKASLANLEAVIANDSDRFYFGDITRKIGVALKDKATEIKGIDAMLPSPFLPTANKPIFLYIKGTYENSLGNYASAISNLRQSYDLGFRRGNIETFLGIIYNNNKQPEEAITWYERAADSLSAQGPNPDINKLYGNMVIAAIESGNGTLIDSTFRRVLSKTMDKNLWHDGLTQLMSISDFNDQEILDVLRLMRATDTLLYSNEYSEYVETADPRRLPNEVLEILQLGESKGHIISSDITFREFKTVASSRLAADKADLPAAERDAINSTSGNSARSTADALLSYGEYGRAITMYKLALERGGIEVDRTRNRLGIALLKNGDLEEAKKSFAALTSANRKKIGEYWTIYANNLQNQLDTKSVSPES